MEADMGRSGNRAFVPICWVSRCRYASNASSLTPTSASMRAASKPKRVAVTAREPGEEISSREG